MKKILSILSLIAVVLTMNSCKENIDFDYHHMEPVYVVEGNVSNHGAEAVVSMTQDMEDTTEYIPVSNATVFVKGNDGSSTTLTSLGNGKYASTDGFKAVKGVTYTMTAKVGDNTYTSYSTMQDSVAIDSLNFKWEKVMNERVLCLRLAYQDIKDDTTYYLVKMYRNDKIYKWAVSNDAGYRDSLIDRSLTCIGEKQLKDRDEDSFDRLIDEGDRIRLELMVIDRRTFDYLMSVSLGKSSRTNPFLNFTGGCLGYFSAWGIASKEIIYKYDEVK